MNNKMKIFAKPNDNLIVVSKDKLDEMRKNTPSKEFFEKCLHCYKLLNKDKNINTVSTEESLKDVESINWSEDVLSGKKKVLIKSESDNDIIKESNIEENLVQSLKEMKLMRQGKMPKKSWEQFKREL